MSIRVGTRLGRHSYASGGLLVATLYVLFVVPIKLAMLAALWACWGAYEIIKWSVVLTYRGLEYVADGAQKLAQLRARNKEDA